MNPNGAFIRTQVGWVQLGGSSHRVVTLTVGLWGRLDIWGHWAVGWDTGVMMSLSHSELASVGGYFWPWKPSSQGRVPGPSVALAAVPASAAQI